LKVKLSSGVVVVAAVAGRLEVIADQRAGARLQRSGEDREDASPHSKIDNPCFSLCVLYLALSLTLGATSSASLAASITPGVAIATCFAPEEDCNAFATDAVNGAEREILISAYSLTTGSGILEALVRAARRGVDVRLIADRLQYCVMDAKLRMVDAVCGPESETEADRQRERDRSDSGKLLIDSGSRNSDGASFAADAGHCRGRCSSMQGAHYLPAATTSSGILLDA
jgi:hypothetical protein